MSSNRPRRISSTKIRARLRLLQWAFVGVLTASPAQASPLLFASFSGVIPTLTVTTQVDVLSLIDGTFTSTGPVVTTLFDVPFDGSVTFDASDWALASLLAPPPGFPFREFTETDPAGGPGLGVETSERIRGQLNLGNGIGPLSFDRQLLDGAAATDVLFPYQGSTRLGYVDGLDGLNPGFSPPFELGDSFYFGFSNAFSRFEPDVAPLFVPGPPGEVFFRGEFAGLFLDIHTGFEQSTFARQNLFGAGPPLAFSWVDPNPGHCASNPVSCTDGYFSFASGFSHGTATNAWGTDAITFQTVSYAGSLVPARVDLRAVTVPEPGSISLIALGLGTIGLVRRRQVRGRRRPTA